MQNIRTANVRRLAFLLDKEVTAVASSMIYQLHLVHQLQPFLEKNKGPGHLDTCSSYVKA